MTGTMIVAQDRMRWGGCPSYSSSANQALRFGLVDPEDLVSGEFNSCFWEWCKVAFSSIRDSRDMNAEESIRRASLSIIRTHRPDYDSWEINSYYS